MAIVELCNEHCGVTLDPDRGAHLLAFAWGRGVERFDILRHCLEEGPTQGAGCFVMAPFANRLAGAQFDFQGRLIAVPMNHAAQHAALHGFSRVGKWEVLDKTATAVKMRTNFADRLNPFAYALEQTLSLQDDGIDVQLTLTNTGQVAMPFGMGLHPWFTKEQGTILTFAAETAFGRTELGFANKPVPMAPHGGFADGLNVSTMNWFDGHFSGWNSRTATIDWPHRSLRVTMTASGALSNLHIYAPDDQPVVCIEPVSHVPDVHNRREFAPFGDYVALAPNESMSGAMSLRASCWSSTGGI